MHTWASAMARVLSGLPESYSAQQVRPGKYILGHALAPPVGQALCRALGALGRMRGERTLSLPARNKCSPPFNHVHVMFTVLAMSEGQMYSQSQVE